MQRRPRGQDAILFMRYLDPRARDKILGGWAMDAPTAADSARHNLGVCVTITLNIVYKKHLKIYSIRFYFLIVKFHKYDQLFIKMCFW